jgi:hypothetical protein
MPARPRAVGLFKGTLKMNTKMRSLIPTAAAGLMLLAATPAEADYDIREEITPIKVHSTSIHVPPPATSANSPPCCLPFDEPVTQSGVSDHAITLRGEIVQSATTEEEEGEPPHKFMALVLDTPLCFHDGVKIAFLEVGYFHHHFPHLSPVSEKWLGHHVDIMGLMVLGEGESFNVQSIKDVK